MNKELGKDSSVPFRRTVQQENLYMLLLN